MLKKQCPKWNLNAGDREFIYQMGQYFIDIIMNAFLFHFYITLPTKFKFTIKNCVTINFFSQICFLFDPIIHILTSNYIRTLINSFLSLG